MKDETGRMKSSTRKSLFILPVSSFILQNLPRDGFEPPTRGFSVHCSTPELPRRKQRLKALSLRNKEQPPRRLQAEIAISHIVATLEIVSQAQ